MTRLELAQAITAAGENDRFWIRDAPGPDALPDFNFIMEPEADGDGWTVFYTERLRRLNEQHFDTESDACDYMFSLIGTS